MAGNPDPESFLLQLTSLPTAAGREDRVIHWVRQWVAQRDRVELDQDRLGNLMLRPAAAPPRAGLPIVFAAHMDHPAFVVTEQVGPQTVRADFRGGVADAYFANSQVKLHRHDPPSAVGRIETLTVPSAESSGLDKKVLVRFDEAVDAAAGDIMTWDLPDAAIEPGEGGAAKLRAPACDDLAGVAAALAAFEAILDGPAFPDVRILLTRAEEVGFVGAIAACGSGILPDAARIVAIENSKSFADSPLGGGPIVRVGDKTSTFDPDLTYRVGKVAEALATEDAGFPWQRRLMPGGTCEASAYQALGFAATCVCLPLENYHNMNEATGRIDREAIALADYHGLIRLLTAIGRTLDNPTEGATLRRRLDDIFRQRRHLLDARRP